MRILLLDDSFAFDGYTPRCDPMSGPEKGLVHLAEALAAHGHDVEVRNRCERPRTVRGVRWRSLEDEPEGGADLVIALRDSGLLARAPGCGTAVLWMASSSMAPDAAGLADAAARHDTLHLVFMGEAHRASWPADDPGARIILPGVAAPYLRVDVAQPGGYWPPRAVTTAHPRADMSWLLDLWCSRIEPLVSGAELHVFSGLLARAASGRVIDSDVTPIFRKAEAAAGQGVRIRRPMPDADMAEEFRRARVHLHPGSPRETCVWTLAESQAAGCPGVTFRQGAAQERIHDGRTGFLAPDAEGFANCAILCLKEDIVYRGRSKDAVDMQRGRSWDDAAAEFEALAHARTGPT